GHQEVGAKADEGDERSSGAPDTPASTRLGGRLGTRRRWRADHVTQLACPLSWWWSCIWGLVEDAHQHVDDPLRCADAAFETRPKLLPHDAAVHRAGMLPGESEERRGRQ